jgi:hypothetical protein
LTWLTIGVEWGHLNQRDQRTRSRRSVVDRGLATGERVKDKVVIVTGAGSIGPGWVNGKAAAVLYAREGAEVLAVDLARTQPRKRSRSSHPRVAPALFTSATWRRTAT